MGKEQQNVAGKQKTANSAASVESLASEILVFPRAVELAIEFGQFYKPKEPELASQLLDEAAHRLKIVEKGGGWADIVGLGDGSR